MNFKPSASALGLVAVDHFDYIIAGAGAAGLSLAWQISQSPQLADKTVLLLDQEQKVKNDRTWSFWAEKGMEIFPDLLYRSWDQIQFLTPERNLNLHMGNYRYHLIRGEDYHRQLREKLGQEERFVFRQARIEDLGSDAQGGWVKSEAKTYTSSYVFSSLYEKPSAERLKGHIYLLQHFVGHVVRSKEAVFDIHRPVMMDFRVPQLNHPTFMYLMPFSAHEALVEYTLFSPQTLEPSAYEEAIRAYLKTYYALEEYEVLHEERGAIPMTDYAFPSGDDQAVVNIGTAAGMSKASTGYTFYRIQKHSRNIVHQLERGQSPALAQQQSSWKLKMDKLMLHLMLKEGNDTWKIFQELFENNPIHRVLSFLNEETGYFEDLLIMNSVPSAPFIRAVIETGWKFS